MAGGLQSEIRALLGQIGLREGADEEEVERSWLSSGRSLRELEDADALTAEEMAVEEDSVGEADKKTPEQKRKEKEERRKAKKEEKKKQEEEAAAAAAQKQEPEAAAEKKADESKQSKKDSKKKSDADANGKASKDAPVAAETRTVVSLSRPRPGKEGAEASAAAAVQSSAPAAPAVPLLNVPSFPAAAAPRTLPGAESGLKWWQAASSAPLRFERGNKAAPSAKGKKVSLDDSARDALWTPPADVDACFALAQERLASLSDTLDSSGSSDARWLSTAMSAGTLSDKVAAMTLAVQESPLRRLGVLDRLLAMAHKQGRRENGMAVEALKDLFLNDLLPPGRKLKAFAAQDYFVALAAQQSRPKGKKTPLPPPPSESDLVYWSLEDGLKKRFLDFLGVLEQGTHDEMAYVKKQRLGVLYELLTRTPEREKVVLSLLVNKLGDADKKIGSKVVFYLTELVTQHPAFKLAVISEMEQLLYRSNVRPRAQYIAIVWMNQLVFTRGGDTQLANKLLHVYFLLFKQFLAAAAKEKADAEFAAKKKAARKKARQEAKSTGQAAKPIGDELRSKGGESGGSNSTSGGSSKHDTFKSGNPDAAEALRSKLLGALLTGINRALPYASSGALDGSASGPQSSGEELVSQQLDVIFQLVHTTSFQTSIQALMLLYQALSRAIASGSGGNVDRFYRALYEKLLSPELLVSVSRHGLFLNLLYKSLKHDTSSERVGAFAKRLLQVCAQASPAFVCGVLFLLSEVSKHQPVLTALMTQPQARARMVAGANGAAKMEEDEEEHFVDAPEEGEEEGETKPAVKAKDEPIGDDVTKIQDVYDASKRDPLYAHAGSSALWELLPLLRHFHPSVSRFAGDLLSGAGISYTGDPLRDFTNKAFLERWVYKNPKQTQQGAAKKGGLLAGTFARPESGAAAPAVHTPAFLSRSSDAVGDDVRFFHRYFVAKAAADDAKAATGKRARDMTEEEEDAFADDIIEREMRRMDPDSWRDDEDLELGDRDASDDDEAADDEDMEGMEGEELDSDAEEAAALAEFEGGQAGDDDSEVELDVSGDEAGAGGMGSDMEDEDDDFAFSDSDMDDDDDEESAPAGKRGGSVFASADEFADLLASANEPAVSRKQSAWEKSREADDDDERPRGGGGKGGRRAAEAMLYKAAPAPTKGGSRHVSKKKGGGAASEKPSFKRKKAEMRGSSVSKKGKQRGGKKAKK